MAATTTPPPTVRDVRTPSGPDTTAALVEAWVGSLVSGSTRDAYRRDLVSFGRWLSDHRGKGLLDADRVDVDSWRDELRETKADTTVARALTAARSFYSFVAGEAQDRKWAFTDPTERVSRPTVKTAEGSTPRLGRQGREALLRAAREAGGRDHLLTRLLLVVGLRVSEACSVTVGGVRTVHDDDDRPWCQVFVQAKGGRQGWRTVDATTCQLIREVAGDRADGPLLATSTGRPLHRSYAWRVVRRLARRAGLDESSVSAHACRVEAITHALDLGASLRDVQDFAAHSDPRTTRRYDRARNAPERSPVHQLGAAADAAST